MSQAQEQGATEEDISNSPQTQQQKSDTDTDNPTQRNSPKPNDGPPKSIRTKDQLLAGLIAGGWLSTTTRKE